MMRKNTLVQTVVLVVAGLVLAIVANGFAAPRRRLVLPGNYPDARVLPQRRAEAPVAPVKAVPATVTAQSPGPGQPPVPVPTATIERPAGVPETTTTTGGGQATLPVPGQAGLPVPQPPAAPQAPAPVPAADPLAKFQPHPDKAYVEISGEDTALLYSKGALFLDARRTSVYEEGHIAGARSFSVWEADVDDKVNALYEERSDPAEQNRPIVIYCSGGACEDSHMLAQKLWGIQFNNVYVYKDGFPDWQQRGGAVRTGAQP
jgi:rhodanese-related sulfurtransferase